MGVHGSITQQLNSQELPIVKLSGFLNGYVTSGVKRVTVPPRSNDISGVIAHLNNNGSHKAV